MSDRGIRQRVQTLNAVLRDSFHQQYNLRAGNIPAEPRLINDQYQSCMQGVNLHYVGLNG